MRIVSKAKYFMMVSVIVIAVGIIVALLFGMNLGIDFTGGTLMTVEMGSEFESSDVAAALEENGVKDAPIVKSSANATSAATQAQIRLKDVDGVKSEDLRAAILEDLRVTYPQAKIYQAETIGAVTSAEIIRNAILAVIIACALMLAYIWIRFEVFSGLAALTALVHDVLIMTAVITLLGNQINSPYIAACLTIVGYSINDTIVLFDRIRENNRKYSHKEYSREEVADKSIKETLSRTINTSVTTLVTITCLYIFGVDSIREFALPLIIGLISGTYSSIFIASPIWVALMNRSLKRLGIKHKKNSRTEAV